MQEGLFCCNYPDCCKTYPTKYNLKRHISVVHLLIRNYSCSYCGKRFTSSQNVRDHELIHKGDKPFPCSLCGKAFRQVSQMRMHRLTHKDLPALSTLELPPILLLQTMGDVKLPSLPYE